jgi:hypothetical protein
MAEDKYEFYTKESAEFLQTENDWLILRGVGYALLAIAHELRVIEQSMDIIRPSKEVKGNGED